MIVGAWQWPIYEHAFSQALSNYGVDVIPCKTQQFFEGFLGKYRTALPAFDLIKWRLNRFVITQAEQCQPNWVLFWRPTHIYPSTLSRLTALGIKTASYNNDDPFGPERHRRAPWHHYYLWRLYKKCLPQFDRNFFYRHINCIESTEYGARHAEVLMPYFIPEVNRPLQLQNIEKERFETDVVFVGHYEPDGRELSVRTLVESGVKIKIWGGHYWSRKVLGAAYDGLMPIVLAEGDDYTKALSGAKVCLAFLSKLNRDTYTRRCFEIPACGRVMLAERTDDLLKIFKEDEEACFFSTVDDLVNKVHWLLENPKARERIAKAGQHRVWADGYDVNSRAKEFVAKLNLTTI